MSRAKMLTPDAAGRELAKVLRVISREREKLADVSKEFKGRIAAYEKRARELVDIANGAAVQVELDTEPAEDDGPAAAVLDEARAVAERRAPGAALALPMDDVGGRPPPSNVLGKRKRDRGRKKADPEKLARLRGDAPRWLRTMLDDPDNAPRFSEHWWPELDLTGEPAHAPSGASCPKNGIDWRGCATCTAAVSRGGTP